MSTRIRSALTLAALFVTCELAFAEQPSIDSLEQQFRALPIEARREMGPLFWLHGDESPERLQMYVEKVAEGGNGCFTAESRPHIDWLGEGWWRDLAVCLDAAKQHNLKMWIFDEKWWPSGEVGGKVPAQYGSKRLTATAVNVTGPQKYVGKDLGGSGWIATIAGKVTADGIDGASLMALAPDHDGVVSWDVPGGDWRVMNFTAAPVPFGNRYIVDGASRDCVDWYLRTVYQPHYDHFKNDFGKDIVGFFYDEPETHGDWGTEVIPMLKARGADWPKALVAYKFKLAGEEQVAARYQYLSAFAEAWGRTMYGGITQWCEQHGVKSIGHWLEHRNQYFHPAVCAGDMFQLQKYSSMGAIDAVYDQFKWGERVVRDAPCWQTPKLGSSITHAYGKPDDITMVEIFGARGQDLSYPEMKWWTDHMQVSGVNFLIPHSFNPRSPRDSDCPPYFYDGGFEPRWPLYRVFADYSSRLSVMLTGGRHVCPVALLWAGQAVHVGKFILPDQVSEALQDALYDCDWLPTDVLENATRVDGKQLRLREEAYRVLVMPAAEAISLATLAKAKAFFDAGGVVIAYGILPSQSTTPGKTSADIAVLRDAVWGDAKPGLNVCKTSATGGKSYFLPEKPTPEQLQQVLAEDAGVHPTLEVLEGQTDHWLHVLHRVKAGCDLFFITNQNIDASGRHFRFRIAAQGYPECWDAMRNEITTVPFNRHEEHAELSLSLEPNESVLLVFRPTQRPLPQRIEPGTSPASTIQLVREDIVQQQPRLDDGLDVAQNLDSLSWVWFAEGQPATNAAPGNAYFRKQFEIPGGQHISRATFCGTADNSFVLYVNGKKAGSSDVGGESWRKLTEIDVRPLLRDGNNQLAIVANNATDKPSPAGLLGMLTVEFAKDATGHAREPMTVPVDVTWKASKTAPAEWMQADFDDSGWPAAMQAAMFGAGPWKRLNPSITLSPVKADPYQGRCEIPANVDLANARVFLECETLVPEQTARVTVNGAYAGGFLGRPLRLEVASHVKAGTNQVRIEPFAPSSVRLAVYPR